MEPQGESKVEICSRFVRHPGIFSGLVQYMQGGFPLTHWEVLLPEGGVISAWYDGGVRIRPRDYDAGQFTLQEFVIIEATPQQAEAFYGFLRSQIGKPYDVLAIAAFVVGRDWQCPDRWYCSELGAAAEVAAGILPAQKLAQAAKITVKDQWMLHAKAGQHA